MYEALGSYVLLKPREKKDKTESGIILPDSAQDSECWAIVVCCGELVSDKIVDGDEVLYTNPEGSFTKTGDSTKYTVVAESNIMLRMK